MTEDNDNTERKPSLRAWLRIADFQVAQAFGAAFAAEGVSRRDGMLLRALSAGPLTTDRDKKLRSLEDRGWATQAGDGTWTLTDDGRAVAARLNERLDGLHATIRDAVGADEYEALASTLESVARALGYEEGQGKPWRGFGFGGRGGGRGFEGNMPPLGPWPSRRGFGPGPHGMQVPPYGPWAGRRGFAPGDGHGGGEGWGHPHHPHGADFSGDRCGHGYGHGHGHGHHDAESAYERGFAAGFAAHDKS